MYDSAVLEEIKFRNDVEDVISTYVTLQRAGSNYKGLCPFHSEKTPSFTVFPATKSFYCFGCGAGGDVVTFIMRTENLEYPSAIEFLARRAGITLPQKESADPNAVKRSRIYDMNRDAAKFFHEQLKQSVEAQEYLAGRQLSGAVIKRFGLGWAPDDYGALTRHMHSLGYTDRELSTGFLCGISQKNNRAYDYFRRRIIFPIIDVSGNVVAFGGRIVGEGQPKYLNTSDTPAFKKGKNLFALNYAKSCCADRLILCEGYMDVIALHAAGFGNAVASLGTALGAEQCRIMAKYTKHVVIAYDGDEAGQRAAAKALKLLEEVGLDARVLRLEGAKDPDEFIKAYGPGEFRRLLDGSVTGFDFQLGNILAGCDLSATEGRIQAAKAVTEVIARVYSAVERELYIQRAAEKLSVSPEMLKNDVERQRKRQIKARNQEQRAEIFRAAANYGDRVNPDAARNIRGAAAEETILGLLMLYPELLASVKNGKTALTEEDFVTEFHRRVFAAIGENAAEDGAFDFGVLAASFTPEEMGRITKMRVDREGMSNNNIALLEDCTQRLKKSKTRSLEETIYEQRTKIQRNNTSGGNG